MKLLLAEKNRWYFGEIKHNIIKKFPKASHSEFPIKNKVAVQKTFPDHPVYSIHSASTGIIKINDTQLLS